MVLQTWAKHGEARFGRSGVQLPSVVRCRWATGEGDVGNGRHDDKYQRRLGTGKAAATMRWVAHHEEERAPRKPRGSSLPEAKKHEESHPDYW